MIPRRIYDQPISNGVNGADSTWLRAINDWEHDSEIPEMAAADVPPRHALPAATARGSSLLADALSERERAVMA